MNVPCPGAYCQWSHDHHKFLRQGCILGVGVLRRALSASADERFREGISADGASGKAPG